MKYYCKHSIILNPIKIFERSICMTYRALLRFPQTQFRLAKEKFIKVFLTYLSSTDFDLCLNVNKQN